MGKELCICGHGKGIHVDWIDDKRCCATWQSRADGFVKMCDCMKYESADIKEKTR